MSNPQDAIAKHAALIAALEATKAKLQEPSLPPASLPVTDEPNEDFDFKALLESVDPEIREGLLKQNRPRWPMVLLAAIVLAILGAVCFAVIWAINHIKIV